MSRDFPGGGLLWGAIATTKLLRTFVVVAFLKSRRTLILDERACIVLTVESKGREALLCASCRVVPPERVSRSTRQFDSSGCDRFVEQATKN